MLKLLLKIYGVYLVREKITEPLKEKKESGAHEELPERSLNSVNMMKRFWQANGRTERCIRGCKMYQKIS